MGGSNTDTGFMSRPVHIPYETGLMYRTEREQTGRSRNSHRHVYIPSHNASTHGGDPVPMPTVGLKKHSHSVFANSQQLTAKAAAIYSELHPCLCLSYAMKMEEGGVFMGTRSDSLSLALCSDSVARWEIKKCCPVTLL